MAWELDFPLRQTHATMALKAPLTGYWVEHLVDCPHLESGGEEVAEACDCVPYTWFASRAKCVAVWSDGTSEEYWKH
jgi:hypothetical protein